VLCTDHAPLFVFSEPSEKDADDMSGAAVEEGWCWVPYANVSIGVSRDNVYTTERGKSVCIW